MHSWTCVTKPLVGDKGLCMTRIRPLRGLLNMGHVTTLNDGMQAPPNAKEISKLALTSHHCDKTKNSKMTANDHDSCSITLVFT